MSGTEPQTSRVPVVRIRGTLTARDGMTIETLGPLIDRAFATAGDGGSVIVDIESAGGSPVQAELLANRIRRAADARRAHVVAIVGEICAAGAYWVACAADEIVAHAMSVVGLNGIVGVAGVLEGGFEASELLRRLQREGWAAALSGGAAGPRGIAPPLPQVEDHYYYYSSESGTRGVATRRQSDTVYAKRLLDDLHDQLKLWVQSRRGNRLQVDATPIFSGSLVLGEQALAVGLVDRLGDLDSLVLELGGENARPQILTPPIGSPAEFLRFAMEAARAFVSERVPARD